MGSVEPVEEAGGAEAGEGRLRRVLGAPPPHPRRSIAIAHPDRMGWDEMGWGIPLRIKCLDWNLGLVRR